MFTDELGRAVRRGDGTRIGKVDDLIVVLGETDPYVVALRVRVGGVWSTRVLFDDQRSLTLTADPERVLANAIDEAGNASTPSSWTSP